MTDPARTTKEQRAHWQEFCGDEHEDGRNEGTWEYADIIALIDDADAADALRAQVAALQEESSELRSIRELCARRPALDKPTLYDNIAHAINTAKRADKAEAELAAAQAKRAVPVDDSTIIEHVMYLYSINEAPSADRMERLARDNAALRTQLQDERENHAQLQARCYEGFPTFSSIFDEYAALRTQAEALERERDAYRSVALRGPVLSEEERKIIEGYEGPEVFGQLYAKAREPKP